MDRMTHLHRNILVAATVFVAGVLGVGPLWNLPASAQDRAYPRQSPLSVRDLTQAGLERSVSIPFGTVLPLFEQGPGIATVELPDGSRVSVRAAELYIPQSPTYVRPGPGMLSADRARLSFWDSRLRAEGFLRHGPSEQTRPFLQEAGIGGMPEVLPVLNTAEVTVRSDRSILLVNGLVPMTTETLLFSDSDSVAATRPVTLHILIDGSVYARDFAQRRLRDFSRMIEVQAADVATLPEVRQTVLFNSGQTTQLETASLSSLRRLLPQAEGLPEGTLSSALLDALKNLRDVLAADEAGERTHIVLILLGPGLDGTLVNDPEFTSVAQELAHLASQSGNIGLLLGSITPEPSEMPALIMDRLGRGLPSRLVAFDSSLDADVADMLRDVTRPQASMNADTVCIAGRSRGFPCLSGISIEGWQQILPDPRDVMALEWFSLPMWFVVDNNLLVLESQPLISSDKPFTETGRVQALESELLREKTATRLLAEQLASAEADRQLLKQDVNRANAAIEESRSEIEQHHALAQSAIAASEDRVAYLQQELVQSMRRARDLDRLLRTTEAQLDQSRTDLAAAVADTDLARRALESESLRVSVLSYELEEAETRIQSLQRTLDGVETVTVAQKENIEALKTDLFREERARRQIEAELDTSKEQIIVLDAVVSSLQSHSDRLAADLRDLDLLNVTLGSELVRITAQLALSEEELARRITQVAQQQSDFDTRYSALGADLADTAAALELALTDVAEREARLVELEAQETESANQRDRLARDLEQARNNADLLEVSLQEMTSQLQLVMSDLDQSRTAEHDLMAQITALSAQLTEKEKEFADLQLELIAVNDALSQSKERDRNRDDLIARLQSSTQGDKDNNLALDVQLDEVLPLSVDQDHFRQLTASQFPVFVQTRSILENMRAEAQVSGRVEHLLNLSSLENISQSLLVAEIQVGALLVQRDELQESLLRVTVESDNLKHQHIAEKDALNIDHSGKIESLQAELSAQEDMFAISKSREIADLHADYKTKLNELRIEHLAELDALRIASEIEAREAYEVLVHLASALGADVVQAAYTRSDHNLLREVVDIADIIVPAVENRVAVAEGLLAQASASLSDREEVISDLTDRLVASQAEGELLREQMQLAIGVANENMQLVAVIHDMERQLLAQEEAHRAEVNDLSRKLASSSVSHTGSDFVEPIVEVTSNAPTVRPRPRPAAILAPRELPAPQASPPASTPREREPTRRASSTTAVPSSLPGSPLVRATAPTDQPVRQGTGFFGN